MRPVATNAALKEWAVVCEALASGRQTVLIRKGGILEARQGFEVLHHRFWLFPTYLHQRATDLVADAAADLGRVQAEQPPDGVLDVRLYAEVSDEVRVESLDLAGAIAVEHVLSPECVASRFHYRNRPGLHVVILRVSRLPAPIRLPVAAWYDGCVSWVELDRSLPTEDLTPVLSDAAFAARRASVLERLTTESQIRGF